jgi:hypothetical protein
MPLILCVSHRTLRHHDQQPVGKPTSLLTQILYGVIRNHWHITNSWYTLIVQRMVTCDILIERETLQVYFAYLVNSLCVRPYGGCVETYPSHSPPSPPKGLVGLRVLRYTGTRHFGFFIHCFMFFFTGGSFPNFVRKRRCAVTIGYVRAYSSTKNAFSARVAIFTQPTPLTATAVTKHPCHVKQTWRVSLSIGMSHGTILCAIQVYRFFVMCQGIINNCIWTHVSISFSMSRVDAEGDHFVIYCASSSDLFR